MSQPEPQKNPNSKELESLFPISGLNNEGTEVKEGGQEEESKNQPVLSKQTICPPKKSSDGDGEIKKGKSINKNGESHPEKFNGPLEKPKTANKAFGSISDFLLFFENRNDEIKEFAQKFQEMENMEKEDRSLNILNENILPVLYKSLKNMPAEFQNYGPSKPVDENEENEFKQKSKKLSGLLSKLVKKKKIQKEKQTENDYSQLFKEKVKSVKEFYERVLQAYTMPGILYLRMNEYLRTEDWIKLDDFLIYTYCIFKAYLWGPTGLTDTDSFADLKSKSENGKLELYRRADFDQGSIDFYREDKIQEFSWIQVTSTSLSESVTKKFAGKKSDKNPVLIVIEVDFRNLKPEDFNGLYLGKLSKFPEEEEVALAPGSIFQLLNIKKEGPEVEMRLRLVTDAKGLAHQGKFLHGMLQSVMRKEDELQISCLKEKELSKAIKLCSGNQLATKLGFSLCNFNEQSAQILLDVLHTMKGLASFTLSSVILEGKCCLDQLLKRLGNKRIKNLELINSLNDDNHVKSLISSLKYFGSLETFRLRFEESYRVNGDLIRELYNKVIQYLDPKCVFELNIGNNCEIILKDLKTSNHKQDFGNVLCQKWPAKSENSQDKTTEKYFIEFQNEDSIKEIPIEQSTEAENIIELVGTKGALGYRLEKKSKELEGENLTEKLPLDTLSRSFEGCKNMTDQDLKSLGCEGIQEMKSLTALTLNFNGCIGVTNRALELLSNDVIQQLNQLNLLHLSFDKCTQITDEGLKILALNSLKYLQSLTALNLSFNECQAVTHEGLKSLCIGVSTIKSLTSLHLSFEYCPGITDEGLEDLFHDDGGIQNLGFLTNLSLNFNNCFEITNEGLRILSHKGLQNFKKSLKTLSLNFYNCRKLTDQGLEILNYEGIHHLDLLTSLSLSFKNDQSNVPIAEKGFEILGSRLSSLMILHLNFNKCRAIADEFFKSLCLPKKLIELHLNFDSCNKITNTGLESLSGEIRDMESLNTLSLSFRGCAQVTDKGFEFLCSQGIQPLKKLTLLHLSFGRDGAQFDPSRISDIGLKSLVSEVLQRLLELKTLHLDFEKCRKITDGGIKTLCSDGIKHLEKLKNLHLNFNRCEQITNKGLKSLYEEGIQNLVQLATLHLGFSNCCEITENHLLSLQYKINLLNLPQLQLPLEIPLEDGNLVINSSSRPNTASVLCQGKLGFASQSNTTSLSEIEPQKVDNLTLKFEQGSGVTDLDISQSLFVSAPMKAYQNLKTLRLTFDGCFMITDFTLHNLYSKGLQHLTSLYLSFDGCYRITDASLANLKFKGMKELVNLSLSFNDCRYITNEGLEALGEIKHLENLKSLHLSFGGCENVSKKGLKKLCVEGIQHLKSLNSLSLNFDSCNITNKGIKILYGVGIKHLKSLKSMYLSFQFCEKITGKGLKRLYHKGMKSLTSFFIDAPDAKLPARLKRQISQSTLPIVISSNRFQSKITTSRLQRQSANTDKGLNKTNLVEKDSVEIFVNKMFTRYLGRNHYVFNAHALEYYDEASYENDYVSNIITDVNEIFKIAKKDLITLYILSSLSVLEEQANKYIKKLYTQELKYLRFLTSLHLILGEWRQYITDSFLETLCLKVFKPLKSLTTLHLSFKECSQITDKGLATIWNDGILHLESLTSLDTSFEKCDQITGAGFSDLNWEGTKYPKHLAQLHLSFDNCRNFKDKGVESLCVSVIQNFSELTSLHLSFDGCQWISDNALVSLNHEGIIYLKFLTELDLSFDRCWLTNQGIQSLLCDVKSLTSLTLHFDQCPSLTDQVFKNFWSEDASQLKSLKALHLSFRGYLSSVTDQGLKDLSEKGIKYLESLESLYLCFDGCPQITNKGIRALSSDGIRYLKLLNTLYLSFSWCNDITEEGLTSLYYDDGIKHINSLTSIHLCFFACEKISLTQLSDLQSRINTLHPELRLEINDHTISSESPFDKKRFLGAPSEDLETLKVKAANEGFFELGCLEFGTPHKDRYYTVSKVEINLKKILLQKLQKNTLKFEDSFHLTDFDISNNCYCLDELENFKTLEAFHIIYDDCDAIANPRMKSFCCDFLPRLESLKNLHISFEKCREITDEELKAISVDGIQNLVNLTELHLNFNDCENITDEGLLSLSYGRIQNLRQLNALHLSFNGCYKISDKGLTGLCSEGVRHLKSLKTLYLSFDECYQITDEVLKSVSLRGILNLSSIETLKLSFADCSKISYSSYQAFLKILLYLGYTLDWDSQS